MTVLALESSALTASIALVTDGHPTAELMLDNGNTHSETLLPAVETLLKMTNQTLADIDLFAVSVGPGSFTGIRIGVATVKGLAFGTGKCCIGVSSLEGLAYRLNGVDGLVCPVLNARRKQVYTALFRSKSGKIERITDDCVLTVDRLDDYTKDYNEPIHFVGDGYDMAKNAVKHPTADIPYVLRHPSATAVAESALVAYENGKRGTDATLTPVYLRPCQAERERLEKEEQKKQNQN